MMIPFGITILAMFAGVFCGFLWGYFTRKPERPATLFGNETDRRGVTISHVAPQNFKPLTPGMREKLRAALPEFRELEDITQQNLDDARAMRRRLGDPAMPEPKMAGLEPLS